MASHWPFGHLQPKLWAKEGPGVKLAVWLPTTKSRESISSRHPIWECDTSLERSRWGLNQNYSPRRDLSNDVLHSQFGGREEVDSWLLVVKSQIASLTPGPSFAHNLGYRCPNDQWDAIFYIYASIPFQWHQEHRNERCFGPCRWTLNIRESRRTPNPQLWKC
jgi:hypothetical protein